jgi:hypothetical protein
VIGMADVQDRGGRRVAWVTGASRGVGRGASVALHPDWVRTEGVLQYAAQLDLTGSQSPEGVGRVIAALAGDPELPGLTGRALRVSALAARYGVDVTS